MKRIVINVFAALCLSAVAASSVSAFPGEGMRCEVKHTGDGFVALRRGPNAKTQLIRKLQRPSASSFYTDNVFPVSRANGWVKVDAMRYDSRFPENEPSSVAWQGSGFIRSSLINWSSCIDAG